MTSRAQFRLLLTAAILTLAACGSSDTNNANAAVNAGAENAAAENAATQNGSVAPATEGAATPAQTGPSAAGAVSAGYMVGKWSAVNEDCSGTVEFKKDGTVTTPIGEAKWTLDGGKLTIDYKDGSTPTTSTIKPLGADRIEITHSSGTKETEKRC